MTDITLPRELVERVLNAMKAAHDESLDERHHSGRQILLIHSIALDEALSQQPSDCHKLRPLTDEEIGHALAKAYPDDADSDGSWKLANYERDIFRVAEAAHGIGVTNAT